MANIWIENHGVFSLNDEKVQELLGWLNANNAVSTEQSSKEFDGKTLLNETGQGPASEQKGTNVGNPQARIKPDGSGTYDFGGTWM